MMMSYQDLPPYLDLQAAPFLARITSVKVGTGGQAGLYLYGFQECSVDPATGSPLDLFVGRADNLATAASTYAIELSNQLVPTLSGTAPS
ncbi:MAG TPA: hypothetical protein VH575_14425, partial [Gemmataceae bacterium]